MRSASGLATVTTSPLIHVHDAVSSTLAFVAPDTPSEKEATPDDVETVVAPSSDTLAAWPVAPSTAEATDTVHDTGGAEACTWPVAPLTSCSTAGCDVTKACAAVQASVYSGAAASVAGDHCSSSGGASASKSCDCSTSPVSQGHEADSGTAAAKPLPLRPTPLNDATPCASGCCGAPTAFVFSEEVRLVPTGSTASAAAA